MDIPINQFQNYQENKKMKMHKCEICDKEFKSKTYLHSHFNRFHDEQKRNIWDLFEILLREGGRCHNRSQRLARFSFLADGEYE